MYYWLDSGKYLWVVFVYMLEITTSARNINSITTMYGNTKVTPAVCGLHGNFYFIHFDYQENKYEI